MVTVVVGVVALALLGVHEWMAAAAGRADRRRPSVWRRVVGVVALLLVLVSGERAELGRRWADWRAQEAPPIAFDPTGDPLLAHAGAAQRPRRPFPLGGDAEAVTRWRADVVADLRTFTNYAPETGHVAHRVVSRERLGDVTRTLVTIDASDGTKVPAYVIEPVGRAIRGGILVVPGHGRGARSPAGVTPEDYQHQAALALGRRGFVTLTPELRGFGLLSPHGVPSHRAVAAAALEQGRSYKAVVVGDLGRVLTVLARWPGVESSRLGVAGASLGGEVAVLLGVLDDRVRAVASQSYGGSTGPTDAPADVSDEAEQTPHGCHTMPGVNTMVWQEDWFRLLAPRPVLVSRGRRNTPRDAEGFVDAVRPAFAAHRADARFTFAVEDGGHEFFVGPVAAFFEAAW